jgi:hypothetical protein
MNMQRAFKPGDRVRDLNQAWYPGLSDVGTVIEVEASGAVLVDWDGDGPDALPVDPLILAPVK